MTRHRPKIIRCYRAPDDSLPPFTPPSPTQKLNSGRIPSHENDSRPPDPGERRTVRAEAQAKSVPPQVQPQPRPQPQPAAPRPQKHPVKQPNRTAPAPKPIVRSASHPVAQPAKAHVTAANLKKNAKLAANYSAAPTIMHRGLGDMDRTQIEGMQTPDEVMREDKEKQKKADEEAAKNAYAAAQTVMNRKLGNMARTHIQGVKTPDEAEKEAKEEAARNMPPRTELNRRVGDMARTNIEAMQVPRGARGR